MDRHKVMRLAEALRSRPRVPAFGTSGIRATIDQLDDLTVYCITAGTIAYLRSVDRLDGTCGGTPIPIGGDLRPSTTRMLRAVARAIVDSGLRYEYAGRVPTPALALRARDVGTACIVVTGSHIPADRNGLKAYARDGELMKQDEQPIALAIGAAIDGCLDVPAAQSPFGADGMFRESETSPLPAPDESAAQAYLERYARAFPAPALSGLRVLVFEHSAVGRDLLCTALESAGAQVIRTGRSDAFVPIDTEALTAEQLDWLAKLAAEHPGIDALVSTDGDGDRPLVLGVSASGAVRFLRGDALGTLVAQYLGVDRIVIPITSSPAVTEWARGAGIEAQTTKVGSPYVIAAMRSSNAAGGARVAGWEANGGFLLGADARTEYADLTALPTRDALLPILATLRQAVRSGRRVEQLASALPAWHAASGLLDGVEPSVGHAITSLLGSSPGGRPSDDPARLGPWEAIESVLEQVCGTVRIRSGSALDGLRLELSNDEIIHVRQSGNAPQLRVYAFAREADRALSLVDASVREPDGLLRQLAEIAGSRPIRCGTDS